MNLKELKEILQILEEKEITEFELEEEGMKLRIRKAVPPSPAAPPLASPGVSVPANVATSGFPVSLPSDNDLFIIKSPIVGTFYRGPDANSPPFVNIGDHVRPGQVLCIIEAMKLMNEIEAEVAGEVVRIELESGQPVQYGEPLFALRPNR